MARLPLVQADLSDMRDWLTPADLREAFRIQPRFVWPDCASLRWTLLSTIVPGALFLRRVLPRAAEPGRPLHASWYCSACLLWAAAAVLSFAAAACLNPGVVPRASAKVQTLAAAPATAPARYVTVNGVLIRQRWCSTCRVHRPLRSKHCSYCDRCVFRFDHHCTWLGNCVGLGNYRSFLVLVVAAALFFSHSMALTLLVLRRQLRAAGAAEDAAPRGGLAEALWHTVLANPGESIYLAYSLVMSFAFLVLLLYHGIIIACNLTTNEHVRDYYLTRNPYDAACTDNYRQVLCAPYGRSLRIEFDPAAHKADAVVVPNAQAPAGLAWAASGSAASGGDGKQGP